MNVDNENIQVTDPVVVDNSIVTDDVTVELSKVEDLLIDMRKSIVDSTNTEALLKSADELVAKQQDQMQQMIDAIPQMMNGALEKIGEMCKAVESNIAILASAFESMKHMMEGKMEESYKSLQAQPLKKSFSAVPESHPLDNRQQAVVNSQDIMTKALDELKVSPDVNRRNELRKAICMLESGYSFDSVAKDFKIK